MAVALADREDSARSGYAEVLIDDMANSVRSAERSGYAVIPQARDKSGLFKWKRYQTERPSLAQLEEWNEYYFNPNWAIVTGAVSKLIVLDFDGPEGLATMERLGLRPHVRTPGGGAHIWVVAPDFRVSSVARVDAKQFPGMDLKAEGGLATFSGHRDGKAYTRTTRLKPYRFEALPPELQELIASREYKERTESATVPDGFVSSISGDVLVDEALAMVRDGAARNPSGFHLACQLRDERYELDEAFEGPMRAYVEQVPNGGHPYTAQEAYDSLVSAYSELAREPRGLRAEASESAASWGFVDLRAALSGERPDPPSILRREDDVALFYRGKTHTVFGPAESMKTWLVLRAAAEQIIDGANVAYIDFEDDAADVVYRLKCLGVNHETILRHFHYMRPEDPIDIGKASHDRVKEAIDSLAPSLIVIDGVTEAMVLHGLDPYRNPDISSWNRVPRSLTHTGGPAVVSIDHEAKGRENKNGPLGGQHKIAGISGAAYRMEAKVPFAVGAEGKARITCEKDRPGRVREHCAGGQRNQVGTLVMSSELETEQVTSYIEISRVSDSPDSSDDESFDIPPAVLETVSMAFEEAGTGGYSKNDIVKSKLPGVGRFAARSIGWLLREGYLAPQPEKAHRQYPPLVSVKPYRIMSGDGKINLGAVVGAESEARTGSNELRTTSNGSKPGGGPGSARTSNGSNPSPGGRGSRSKSTDRPTAGTRRGSRSRQVRTDRSKLRHDANGPSQRNNYD